MTLTKLVRVFLCLKFVLGRTRAPLRVALISVIVRLRVPLFTASASFSRGFFMPEICVGTDSSATQSGANISYSPPAGTTFYDPNQIG